MKDRLLKYFPTEVKKYRAQAEGFEADLETSISYHDLAASPLRGQP